MANLNEAIIHKDLIKSLNEAVTEKPQENKRPEGAKEWTFADWFGKDLTGETYDGDISCYRYKLTSLKGAPKEVRGDFWCSHNQLTSLEGAPEKVGGSFYCGNNQLTSLEGASKEVGGDFDCGYNRLTSLKNAPKVVNGSLLCWRNQLTSLKGAPEKVGRDFDCSSNQLTSLKGAPKEVGRDFNCSNNQLTSFEGVPEKVGWTFDCDYNKLISLEGAPKEIKGSFYCGNNQLTSLKGAPEKVGGTFGCSYNQLTSLKGAPKEVKGKFDCSDNQLTSLEGAPEKVGWTFDCENNQLTSLEGLKKIGGEILYNGNKVSRIKSSAVRDPKRTQNIRNGRKNATIFVCIMIDEGGMHVPFIYDNGLFKRALKKLENDDMLYIEDEFEINFDTDFTKIGNCQIDRWTSMFIRNLGNGNFKVVCDKDTITDIISVDEIPENLEEFDGNYDEKEFYLEVKNKNLNSSEEIADALLVIAGDEEQYGTDSAKTSHEIKFFK